MVLVDLSQHHTPSKVHGVLPQAFFRVEANPMAFAEIHRTFCEAMGRDECGGLQL